MKTFFGRGGEAAGKSESGKNVKKNTKKAFKHYGTLTLTFVAFDVPRSRLARVKIKVKVNVHKGYIRVSL